MDRVNHIRLFFSILIVLLSICHCFAQTEMEINENRTSLYSFLKIESYELRDTIADTTIIDIRGPWGDSKWYKKNDSTYYINLYTNLPVKNSIWWKRFMFAKLTLKIFKDSYSIKRNKTHIPYSYLTNQDIIRIKEEVKHPCENFSFRNIADYEKGWDEGESSARTAGWCAIAIMNGHREFINAFNVLSKTICANGEYLEAYYELQSVLTFFELKIVKQGNEYHGKLKEY